MLYSFLPAFGGVGEALCGTERYTFETLRAGKAGREIMSSFLEEAVGAGLQRGDIADLVARAAGVDVGASLYPKD